MFGKVKKEEVFSENEILNKAILSIIKSLENDNISSSTEESVLKNNEAIIRKIKKFIK